jgi:hypothetical protein
MAGGSIHSSFSVADVKVLTHNRLLLVVVQSGLMPTHFSCVCPIPVSGYGLQ